MHHVRVDRHMEGVLFDYGGTLVSNREADEILYSILTSLDIAIGRQEFDSTFMKMRSYWEEHYSSLPRGNRWSGQIMEDCNVFFLKSAGFFSNPEETASLIREKWSTFDRRTLFPDVSGTLAAIRKASFRIGIVSQNRMMSDVLRSELNSLGIGHFFDAVVTSEEEGYDKPDPGIFLAASSKLGIQPERLFHVGDIFEKDVAGALAAGMSPVLLDREEKDTSGYVPKIRRLDELIPIITARSW